MMMSTPEEGSTSTSSTSNGRSRSTVTTTLVTTHTGPARTRNDGIRIGEAARLLGVCPKTLRRWEARGWLLPAYRTPGGHRRYHVETILHLRTRRCFPTSASSASASPETTTMTPHEVPDVPPSNDTTLATSPPPRPDGATPTTTTTTIHASASSAPAPAAVVSASSSSSHSRPPTASSAHVRSRVAVIYGRVSGHSQKEDLQRQLESLKARAHADGHHVAFVAHDIASGLNPQRPGLRRLLTYCFTHRGLVDRLYVTHPDRLARFSTKLLTWILERWCHVEVIFTRPDGAANDAAETRSLEQELVEDVLAILYSFTARLHRRRRGHLTHGGTARTVSSSP